MKTRGLVGTVLVVVSLSLSACSVYMAATQPPKKNLGVFEVGTPRSELLAEVGPPSHTEIKDGKKTELFTFVQGYSTGTRVGRSIFHGVADVFSVGLWEVVGTPIEGVFSGNEMTVQVTYDADERIEHVDGLRK